MCVSDLFLIDLCFSSVPLSSIFKHYRVTRMHDGSFIIDVENPVSEKEIMASRTVSPQSQMFLSD